MTAVGAAGKVVDGFHRDYAVFLGDFFLDESLKRFETVFPAVGSGSSAIELNLDELYEYSKAAEWIDVCKLPELAAE